ncbi:glycosyltransferase [Actinomycetospora sp. OC33-EN08]|uniref:Glycosyltransferase n=1 Tax=Actinomycetospora aurantiaca TaxID=3129233 RepID=A0ABU8MGW1_9PSEU
MSISVVIVSKDEPALAGTLAALVSDPELDVVVVDASAGRLDGIRDGFPAVRWFAYTPPPGVRTSIAHQRNVGVAVARGDVVVFTDAGCVPQPGWLARLVAPILAGEDTVACGPAVGTDVDLYGGVAQRGTGRYVDDAPTINLAFRRTAWEEVGGFDERFAYGSDVDFTWRLAAAGHRARNVPDAVVTHDWGGARRQLRRAHAYGRARVRLYGKHRDRLRGVLRRDPVPVAYALFLVGLPLALRWPAYVVLLAVPLLRNRSRRPLLTVADHLAYGAGVLRELPREVTR